MTSEEIKKVLDLHKKWLNNEQGGERANLSEADLRGANLSEADLRKADLHWADLREADLHWAELSEANLSEANLHRANLRGAELYRANLIGAVLSGAELYRANLSGADLRRAELRGADLRGADLDFSCFPLWCGGSKFKCDTKLVYQLLAHICTLDFSDDEGIKELIMPFAQKSHRAQALGIRDKK